ncbi:hypothetical protein JAG25_003806 [Citrobacter werkmanii]|nr:hypothetical protein [Citrobacter werkmanii]
MEEEKSCTKDEDNEFSGAIQREIDSLKITTCNSKELLCAGNFGRNQTQAFIINS